MYSQMLRSESTTGTFAGQNYKSSAKCNRRECLAWMECFPSTVTGGVVVIVGGKIGEAGGAGGWKSGGWVSLGPYKHVR